MGQGTSDAAVELVSACVHSVRFAFGAPLGLERFAEVCQAVKIPALALGGINLSNFHEPLQRGAAGIAAISLFTDHDRIEQNIQTILNTQITP